MRLYQTLVRGASMIIHEVKDVRPNAKDLIQIQDYVPRPMDPFLILYRCEVPSHIKNLQIRSHDNQNFLTLKSETPLTSLDEFDGTVEMRVSTSVAKELR